jgi:hypothetical protein
VVRTALLQVQVLKLELELVGLGLGREWGLGLPPWLVRNATTNMTCKFLDVATAL